MKWMGVVFGIWVAQAGLGNTAYVDFEHKLIFPQQLGGMACETVEKYDNEALGYSLFYSQGEALQLEVSVLNLGRAEVGNGPKADGVNVIFQGVEVMQARAEEEGAIEDLKKRGSLVVPPKSPLQFANTVYQYSEFRTVDGKAKSIPRMQSVYVTGSHNHFIKVQFRFDVAKGKEARVAAEQLVKQLVLLLIAQNSEDDLILAACDALLYNPGDYSGMAAAQRVFARAQSMGELDVYDAFFVWPQETSKPENADLLVSAYFAGMLKVVIPGKLESGGAFEAFSSMLDAYSTMRTRDQITAIPRFDEWLKISDRKAIYQKLLVDFGYVAP
ncbi:hypothetical protein P4C99_20015 [Pontiellaceae bacterium B1224]|nr:hypothetical protein [Pontiellaceae bacterium B1224]